MPAAALAFRQGHISPARKNYCLMLNRDQLFNRDLNCKTTATIRTLVEQSRLAIGLPAVKELPWLEPTADPQGRDHCDRPRSRLHSAWAVVCQVRHRRATEKLEIRNPDDQLPQNPSRQRMGRRKTLQLGDVTIRVDTRKAVVALTSLDDQPLASSRSILITTVARAVAATPGHLPYLSEPVVGIITLRTKTSGLELLALSSTGKVQERLALEQNPDGLTFRLPTHRGTHWYALRTSERAGEAVAPQLKSSGQ